MILAHDEHPNARALRDRLDDVGRRQHVAFGHLEPRRYQPLGHRHVGGAKQVLGDVLLHGERRRHHAGMAVRDRQNFEHALQRAVLARSPVQHVEGNVRLDRGEHRGDVAAHVDAGHPMATPRERLGAGLAGAQRYLALGGPASHQNGDVLAHSSASPER